MDECRRRLAAEFDWLRTALILEPRGSEVIVGALVCEPHHPEHTAGVVFFNNVKYIGMCGHGMIGVVTTLAHLGRIAPGKHYIETPVGLVTALLSDDGQVSVENVPSYRYLHNVPLELPDGQQITGDVAWGGNWFFLVSNHGRQLTLERIPALTDYCWNVRHALEAAGITGRDGAEIDHVELFAQVTDGTADSQNFVLCPGGAYDRSPCGTGTSAKIACLAEDNFLKPGETWRQKSIVGSVFAGRYRRDGDQVIPTIVGKAYLTADSHILIDPDDPFALGIV